MAVPERAMGGQGATEYLVLLGVVLIIALASVALLGFFPGSAAEAREEESRLYWNTAAPLAIVEWEAQSWWWVSNDYSATVLRIRNNGNYPISLVGLLGEGQEMTQLWNPGQGNNPFSYYGELQKIAPGGEVVIGGAGYPGAPQKYGFVSGILGACTTTANYLCAAKSLCRPTASGSKDLGYFEIDHFGFEYVVYAENAPITKKMVGAVPLVIKCTAGS